MSMQSILAASQSLSQIQSMQSARTKMSGAADVLRIESKLEGGNKKKDAQASALEDKANKMMEDMMEKSTDINETLKPDEDIEAEEEAKAEEANKQPQTDKVELSDSAAKHLGEPSATKPVTLEAVTYKADGSTTPSAPAKAGSKIEVNV